MSEKTWVAQRLAAVTAREEELGVFASVPGALTRREQLMSSRGSCIGYKGGRAGREAVQALVRARPSRSLARAVIGV